MNNFQNRPKYTPENINSLLSDEVFVFGSNLSGHHVGGAAKVALNKFGAIYGKGIGLQGQSYAIPTMQGGVETIAPYVDDFIEFAKNELNKFFYVTRIGCGIAGFSDEEIAPLFEKALILKNVCLPESFYSILKEITNSKKSSENNEFIETILTTEVLKSIRKSDIIYAEVSAGGAMGCAGQAMIYTIKENQLFCYITNLFTDEKTYHKVQDLLFSNSEFGQVFLNRNVENKIEKNQNLFNHHYGGFGNQVFINENVKLKENIDHFLYFKDNQEYHIYCSVVGVYKAVIKSISGETNKKISIEEKEKSPDHVQAPKDVHTEL